MFEDFRKWAKPFRTRQVLVTINSDLSRLKSLIEVAQPLSRSDHSA